MSGKRKTAVILGIIFVTLGVFLLTFGLSFKLMSVPSGQEALKDAQIEQLNEKINELEKENRNLNQKTESNDTSLGTIPSTKTVKEGTTDPSSVQTSASTDSSSATSSKKTSDKVSGNPGLSD